MRLPSFPQVAGAAAKTFRRFPFAIVCALVGSVALIVVIDQSEERSQFWWLLNSVFLASTLGIALFTTVVLVGERGRWSSSRMFFAQCAAAVLLVLYWLLLPEKVFEPPYYVLIRHWLLLLGVHLLAAFAPYTGPGEVNGFWQYNRSMFLRFLTAALFSAVLWSGLAIAIAAVNNLFNMEIRPERYGQLWVLIAGVFNTWFFLSGVPEDLDELDRDTSYPKGLKVFTQHVLLPLVVVYVLILYAYLAKIIIDWDWPKGWVANLVLGFSITGIFSLLLVHPIREQAENVWIKRFSRYYYLAEIPLVVVLLLAIWRRVEEYGVTENRFFVIILGLWLAATVAYFLVSKSGNIKIIPSSLCVLTFLFSFGPWGAFQISERNQLGRLEQILTTKGMLQQGKVTRATAPVGFDDAREISSTVRYLSLTHGVAPLQPWFAVRLDTLSSGDPAASRAAPGDQVPRAVVQLLGVDYIPQWQERKEPAYHRFSVRKEHLRDVRGYDQLLRGIAIGQADSSRKSVSLAEGGLRIGLSDTLLTAALSRSAGSADTVLLPLAPLVRTLLGQSGNPFEIPGETMVLNGSGGTTRLRAFVTLLLVRAGAESISVQRIECDLLIGSN